MKLPGKKHFPGYQRLRLLGVAKQVADANLSPGLLLTVLLRHGSRVPTALENHRVPRGFHTAVAFTHYTFLCGILLM